MICLAWWFQKVLGSPYDMELLRVPNPKPVRYPYSRWRFHRFTHLLGEQNIDLIEEICRIWCLVTSLHLLDSLQPIEPIRPSEYPGIEAHRRSRLGWRSGICGEGESTVCHRIVESWSWKCNGWNLESKTIWDQSRYTKNKKKKIIVKSNLPLISVEKKQSLHLKRVLMSDWYFYNHAILIVFNDPSGISGCFWVFTIFTGRPST